jgi:hypothetical protein
MQYHETYCNNNAMISFAKLIIGQTLEHRDGPAALGSSCSMDALATLGCLQGRPLDVAAVPCWPLTAPEGAPGGAPPTGRGHACSTR